MTSLDDMVRRGDPDRHAATLAAPEAARAGLFALYAFNLEIARAPWMTAEPMIAQMRLQFWHDTLDGIAAGAPPRAHEVAEPLTHVWRAADLPVALGHAMIEARRWDITRERFADAEALLRHLDATSGNLMWLAALSLGAPADSEAVVRDMGVASGLANWLIAVPELTARGCPALPDDSEDGVSALARTGLARLGRARAGRAKVPASVHPALLAGWQAGPVLRRAAKAPRQVSAGGLQGSEFARRGGLFLRALSGRW